MQLFDRLLKFTSFRPRSEFEIKRWLARKKIDARGSEAALQTLKKTGLIDDGAFAHWWVEQRSEFRPKAGRALVFELVKKGVDKNLAESVVGASEKNDEELAVLVLEKRKKAFDRYDPETRRQKVVNLLASRGFGWGVINKILKNYVFG